MYFKFASPFVLAAALFATSAHANQQVDACVTKLKQACGVSSTFQALLADQAEECKNMKSASGNTRYQLYRANGHLLSVALDGPGACDVEFTAMSEDHAKEVKIFGNKATIETEKGGAYVLRYEGESAKLYQFVSGSKKPYGTTVKASIKGVPGANDKFIIELSDGNSRTIDADAIQDQIRKGRLVFVPATQFDIHSSLGLIFAIQSPPPAEGDTSEEPVAPPPPGYDRDFEDLDVTATYGFGNEVSLGGCEGYVRAKKLNSYRSEVYFSVSKCSRLDFSERGMIETDGKLDTSSVPYTGSWILRQDPEASRDHPVRVVLQSRSGKTGVNLWVHF